MKILTLVPSFNLKGGGGVANQYQGLKPYWNIKVIYCTYGRRRHIHPAICLLPDIFIYLFKLIAYNIDVVIINPSFRNYQLKRDGLYLLLAKLFRRKVVTFIHGWDEKYAKKIEASPKIFCKIYKHSSLIYVLYSGFKKQLESFHLNVPILLSSTKVEDKLLYDFDINKTHRQGNRILFLARADKLKGLDVAIKAFEIVLKKLPNTFLEIGGEGDFLQPMKEYVLENHLPNITFHGHVTGSKKINLFKESDIYILPTHGEGMATTILEAMAFGLVVLTRPIGGVVDFLKENEMGSLIQSLNPEDFAEKIIYFLTHKELCKKISINNFQYAQQHFLASNVAKKIEHEINLYCNETYTRPHS